MPDVYEHLNSEAFGFLRPWEVRKLTDYQIEGMFLVNKQRYEEFRKLHPELAAPAASEQASSDSGGVASEIQAYYDRGEFPPKDMMVDIVCQLPGITREQAGQQWEYQKAEWEKWTSSEEGQQWLRKAATSR